MRFGVITAGAPCKGTHGRAIQRRLLGSIVEAEPRVSTSRRPVWLRDHRVLQLIALTDTSHDSIVEPLCRLSALSRSDESWC